MLTTLVEALAANLRERERSVLFELGRVYLPREGQTLPDEPNRASFLATAGLPLASTANSTRSASRPERCDRLPRMAPPFS